MKLNGSTLKKGTDYTVSYKNNKNAGTATVTIKGTGSYKGKVTKNFTISKCSVGSDDGTEPGLGMAFGYSTPAFTGSAQKPIYVELLGTGTRSAYRLKKGTDYRITYKNNINAGTATFTVTGIGNFTGSYTGKFMISQANLPYIATATLSKTTYKYNGKARKPSVKVVNKWGKTLKKGTDYTVTYSNNKKVGTATVKITGKGNYKGTITKTFKITK